MIINKTIVRNFIFALFALLTFSISMGLMYSLTIESKNITFEQQTLCDGKGYVNITQFSFFLKLMLAFVAGGLVSDRLFMKIGVF
jgi:hypothetical protein